MEEKKVAIVSFHRADNYGAVLQNYALQQANINIGTEVYTADLCCDNIENEYKNQLIPKINGNYVKKMYYFILNCLNYMKNKKHKEAFDKFRRENLKLTKEIDCLSEIENDYDILITGSDQVWNRNIIGETSFDNYLLNTVHNIRKVSYAGSCGHISNLDNSIIYKISNLDYITVRESTLANVLRNFIEKDITIVCDPVFLLDKKEWISRIQHINKRDFQYILLYYNRLEELEIAKYLKKQKLLKIIYPCKKHRNSLFGAKSCYEDGPFDFLNDILNAEIVVASSFHAIAFSILLEKDFIAVLNKEADTRASDLLKFVGLENRIVCGLGDYIDKQNNMVPIDYTEVREKLAQWRKESLSELKKMCMLE